MWSKQMLTSEAAIRNLTNLQKHIIQKKKHLQKKIFPINAWTYHFCSFLKRYIPKVIKIF